MKEILHALDVKLQALGRVLLAPISLSLISLMFCVGLIGLLSSQTATLCLEVNPAQNMGLLWLNLGLCILTLLYLVTLTMWSWRHRQTSDESNKSLTRLDNPPSHSSPLVERQAIDDMLASIKTKEKKLPEQPEAALHSLQKFTESWRYQVVDAAEYPNDSQQMVNIFNHLTHSIQMESLKLAKVLESLADGLLTIDERGRIDSFNPAAERIFGYQAAEIVGRNAKSLMPDLYCSSHDHYFKQFQENSTIRNSSIGRELTGKRKDGSIFPIDLSISPMIVDGQNLSIGVVRDITERKKIEIMKNEFIATVSHELRTPLTAILGAVELVLSGVMGTIPKECESLLAIVTSNSKRLIKLINNMLDIEKIESGNIRLELKPLRLLESIEAALACHRPQAQSLDIQLIVLPQQPDLWVIADADALMQVLTNLISNALKFSAKGAQVDIGIELSSDMARLTVNDYGSGIPSAFKDKIFGKFSQADGSSSRQQGGSGLGLSICKAMIEQMHGRISYESSPHIKTSFFVDLPLWQDDQQAKQQTLVLPEMTHGSQAKPRVLHIESDADISHVVGKMLLPIANVEIAASLASAKTLLAQPYDLIIIELSLAEDLALEFLGDLKAQWPNTSVFVFSALEREAAFIPFVRQYFVKSKASYAALLQAIQHEFNP